MTQRKLIFAISLCLCVGIIVLLSFQCTASQTITKPGQTGRTVDPRRSGLENVIANCTRAIRQNPNEANAYFDRSDAFIELGSYNNASNDLSKVISIDPKNVDAYISRGYVYSKLGKYQRAIDDFISAIGLDPTNADLYLRCGHNYLQLGQKEKAVEQYAKAIQLDPKAADAYTCRGLAYGGLQQFQKSIDDFTTAISLDPTNAQRYVDRGVAYHEIGLYKSAVDDLTKALHLNPKNADALKFRDLATEQLRQGDLATRGNPDDPDGKLAADESHPALSPSGRYELRVIHHPGQVLSFQIWDRGQNGLSTLLYYCDKQFSAYRTTVFAWDDMDRVWVYNGRILSWALAGNHDWRQVPQEIDHAPIPGVIKRFRPVATLEVRRGQHRHVDGFNVDFLAGMCRPNRQDSLFRRVADSGILPESVSLAGEGYGKAEKLFVIDPQNGDKREEFAAYIRRLSQEAQMGTSRLLADNMATQARVIRAMRIIGMDEDANQQLKQLNSAVTELSPTDNFLPTTIDSIWTVAELTEEAKHHGEAEQLYRKVAQLLARAVRPGSLYHATIADDIARCCEEQGRLSEAIAQYRDSAKIRETVLGTKHPDTAFGMGNLALTLLQSGDLASAAETYDHATAIFEKELDSQRFGFEDQLDIADLYSEYADTLKKLGRADVAKLPESRAQKIHQVFQNRLNAFRMADRHFDFFPEAPSPEPEN